MQIKFECRYCGRDWTEECPSEHHALEKLCPECGDSNIKFIDSREKVNYYEGAPEFEDEEEEHDEVPSVDEFFDYFSI